MIFPLCWLITLREKNKHHVHLAGERVSCKAAEKSRCFFAAPGEEKASECESTIWGRPIIYEYHWLSMIYWINVNPGLMSTLD
jgi:hypothetical protein